MPGAMPRGPAGTHDRQGTAARRHRRPVRGRGPRRAALHRSPTRRPDARRVPRPHRSTTSRSPRKRSAASPNRARSTAAARPSRSTRSATSLSEPAPWRLHVTPRARRDIRQLDPPIRRRILDALDKLAADPRKAFLHDHEGGFLPQPAAARFACRARRPTPRAHRAGGGTQKPLPQPLHSAASRAPEVLSFDAAAGTVSA
jgi:hypothetical protein